MVDYRSRRYRRSTLENIFFLKNATRLILFGLIALVIVTFGLFLWYSRDLPTPGNLSAKDLPQSTKIYDRNGVVLYDIFNQQNRTYVAINDIPKTLREATVSIEDKDFYKNNGFSITGYLRVIRDFLLFRRVTGGSTLTQQLVKNTLLSSERTISRKIKEFILAVQVDRSYSKDQILELYLNIAPYGGTMVGVEAAAEGYFGKKAKDLSLVQSAILAGLPQSPSYNSPYGPDPKAYIDRTQAVLRRMREDGYITEKQETDADKELKTITFNPSNEAIKAPHFSFYVKDLLIKQFGENVVEQGGLQVTTTLDYALEQKAEKIVSDEVIASRYLNVGNGATVVMNPKNGEILAMVGSRDFFATESATTVKGKTVPFEGQFNVAVQGERQPGSSIKPVMYATALSKGYTAATLLMDTPVVFPNQGGKDYIPVNYDGKFRGPIQMRFALGSSLNIPAVKMLALIGIKNMLTTAYSMGISSLEPTDDNVKRFGLSITLGGGEVTLLDMASSYSAFANSGLKVTPVAITKVTDPKGNVLYENKDHEFPRVLSKEVTYIIDDMLSDNNARLLTFGANSYLHVAGRTISVKTGTTDDKRDNWTIGWTPSILVATWVGNNDNSPMNPTLASGVTGAAPIWRNVIVEALKGKPNEEFPKPDDVISLTIDSLGGGAPVSGQSTRSEYFIKGTEPQGPSPIYKQIKISKSDSNKLASDSEISNGQFDTKQFIVFTESDPFSADGKNRWQEGIDQWVNDNHKDDPLYHPPTEKSSAVISNTPTPGPTNTPTPIVTPTDTPSSEH